MKMQYVCLRFQEFRTHLSLFFYRNFRAFLLLFNYRIAFSRRLRIIYGNMRLDNARFFRCDLLQRISEILFMIKTDRSDH